MSFELTLDLLLPVLVTVVDGKVGTTDLLADTKFVIRTSGSNDLGTHSLGNLDSANTDTSGTSVNEHPLILLDFGTELERSVTGRPSDEQSSGLFERDTLGHLHQLPVVGLGLFAVSAVSGTKDTRLARNEIAAFRNGRVLGDDTGHLDTGDVRMRLLVLVLALNSENVEEVEGGRVDVDQDLVGTRLDLGFRNIVGQYAGELGWSNVLVQVVGPHYVL